MHSKELRQLTVSALGQDLVLMKNDLINDELSRRYNYMSFLGDYVNGVNANALSFGNMSQANSTSGTNYNRGVTSSSSGTDWIGTGSSLLASIGSQLLSYYLSK